ncbi:MAG TPA: methylated-DNA--[protein]-cysteine S-methyltransferase [Ilumatobacteraceae bacterium]|nr:methylated-DNA--[protein]-cysteine S-methyltransferase [Ilumatobacteraceae bacterium]
MNTTTEELSSTTMDSPVGELTLVASAHGVRAVLWEGEHARGLGAITDADPKANEVLDRTVKQLDEYFHGDRTDFDLPLDPRGTDFQLQVWEVLRTIPYGRTISYGEQARRLGDVNKSRAVGAANGRNPISIIVPCHRVVGADGSLTGFGGGLENKAWLLDHERGVNDLGL